MAKWKKLAHVVYQCSYHIVWTPKYRYRILEGEIAKIVEEKIRAICEWKDVEILEVNVMKDHVHMVVSIPPRVSISELMGILKGKTAIALFKGKRKLKKKPYWGNHFWSRGYCVTTRGMDEEKIRRYVKYQEENERIEENNSKEYGLF
ncbi:MAG: IS200/IS605 family transposase [Rectinema subterraneum]|uniref:IS200/IS605 family transposase n=1 Tax=Rectinema subterraneum TaxID=2653714 RepID=UPI003C79CE04